MNRRFTYVGCFISPHDFRDAVSKIRKSPLENDVRAPHVTFEYKPKEVDRSLFGTPVRIRIVGYGNDGENEWLKVQLDSSEPRMQRMIEELESPHITIAVCNGGEPANTKRLTFEEIEPIELTGKYGGYTKRGSVVVRSIKNKRALLSGKE